MSIISKYINSIEKLIDELPFVLSKNIVVDNRSDIAFYIKGKIIFTNDNELHIKEYFIAIPELKKIAYSYHYQNKNKELIFRYDNAEHHPEIKTYPYHKHNGNKVCASKKTKLKRVLFEIIDKLY